MMTQIAISDDVAAHLAAAAADRGCTQEDLASVLLEEGLRRDDDFVLSPQQETRLLESIEQAQRGELVDGDSVMAQFGRAMKEIESK
jgi:hypothetical protein